MLKPVSCDLIIKGFTFDVECEDSDVIQKKLSEVLKAFLDANNIAYEQVHGVDSEMLLKATNLYHAMNWAQDQGKIYLAPQYKNITGAQRYHIPALLKAYEAGKGHRSKL